MRTIEVPYVAYMIVDEVDALAAGCTRFGRHAYGAFTRSTRIGWQRKADIVREEIRYWSIRSKDSGKD